MRSIKIIAINSFIFFCLIVVAELIFGTWIFKINQLSLSGVPRDVSYVYHQDLNSSKKTEIIYKRDKYGLRGGKTFNKPSEISILTVGGSTTDLRYMNLNETWPQLLESKLNTHKIANAGVDGQSTYGHIESFKKWFCHIPNFNPEYIIFYIGVNDLGINSREKPSRKWDIIKSKPIIQKWVDLIKNNSAIYSLFRKFFGLIEAKKMGIGHKKINFKNTAYYTDSVSNPYIDYYSKYIIPSFSKRIDMLIKMCEEIGSEPIFISQPSYYYKYSNNEWLGVDKKTYVSKDYYFNGTDVLKIINLQYNAITKCCEKKNYTAINLSHSKDWKDEDFYDYFHMTYKGCIRLSEKIYKALKVKLMKNKTHNF